MSIKYFLLIISVIFSSNCTGPVESSAQKLSFTLSDSLTIQYQDTLYNANENIWITLDSLVQDSRCPINVTCVWAGNAKMALSFGKDNNKSSFELNSNRQFRNDTTLYGYNIQLIDVKPYPHTDSTYVQKDYSTRLLIKK